MNLREGLGYTRLSSHEQQAYKTVLAALSSMAVSFDFSQIHPSVDLMKIINSVLGDNPSVIYFNKTAVETIESGLDKQIELTGVIPKPQVEKMILELEEKAEQMVSSVKAGTADDYARLLKLYDVLQSSIRYDKQELQAMSSGKSNNPLSHNAYGSLVNGVAVCDGFSAAFTLLANRLGYESMLVTGDSLQSPTVSVKHSWNVVKVNGRHYHMDVTWDARKYHEYEGFSYSYFALDDEDIANDHEWEINTTPACSYNDLSFFLKNGLFANNIGQCADIIRATLKKQSSFIRLRLSYNIALPENTGDYLMQLVMTEARKHGISKRFEYYWNDQTRCFYLKFLN